jgi:hypothetical protein
LHFLSLLIIPFPAESGQISLVDMNFKEVKRQKPVSSGL